MTGIIRLCYSKVIDKDYQAAWDKNVFHATHKEFYMQAQQFDQQKRYSTFHEMLAHLPKAEGMHYLVSTAAKGYLLQLNNLVPDVTNAAGKLCVPFRNFKFEILQSHVSDKSQHRIALSFYSEPLLCVGTLESRLVFAALSKAEAYEAGEEVETDTLLFRPGLSISSFRKIKEHVAQS